MHPEWKRYCRRVARRLPCSPPRRRELIQGLTPAFEQLTQDIPNPSSGDILDAFGPPEELAQMLADQLSPEETAQFRRWRRLRRIAGAVLILAILALSIYVFWLKETRTFWVPVMVRPGPRGTFDYLLQLLSELFFG